MFTEELSEEDGTVEVDPRAYGRRRACVLLHGAVGCRTVCGRK